MQSSTFEYNRSHNRMHLKQSAEPWLNLVVALTQDVVIPLAVVIPEALFVYHCSHKDLSVLALREESCRNTHHA
jgi:hypothetical protein